MTRTTSQTSLSALRRDHAYLRRLIARLRLIGQEADPGRLALVDSALGDVVSDIIRHVLPAMRAEEAGAYPLVARALGSGVPVRILLAEHRAIREELGAALHALSGDDPTMPADEHRSALVRRAGQLADELELHLRREEAAFGTLFPRQGGAVA